MPLVTCGCAKDHAEGARDDFAAAVDAKEHNARPKGRGTRFFHPRHFGFVNEGVRITPPIVVHEPLGDYLLIA